MLRKNLKLANINMKKIELKEITPKNFRCGIGACSAIFETDNKFVIIGKVFDDEKLKKRIGKNEAAIEVPKELLSHCRLK